MLHFFLQIVARLAGVLLVSLLHAAHSSHIQVLSHLGARPDHTALAPASSGASSHAPAPQAPGQGTEPVLAPALQPPAVEAPAAAATSADGEVASDQHDTAIEGREPGAGSAVGSAAGGAASAPNQAPMGPSGGLHGAGAPA